MKFKSQAKQNQLIENITSNHLVIGIESLKRSGVARAVNFHGIVLGNPLEFSSDVFKKSPFQDHGFSPLTD
jgi:transposase